MQRSISFRIISRRMSLRRKKKERFLWHLRERTSRVGFGGLRRGRRVRDEFEKSGVRDLQMVPMFISTLNVTGRGGDVVCRRERCYI